MQGKESIVLLGIKNFAIKTMPGSAHHNGGNLAKHRIETLHEGHIPLKVMGIGSL